MLEISNPAFLQGNLHFKPINARFYGSVLFLATELDQRASQTRWHGHLVRMISGLTLISGTLITVPMAITETFLSAAIGTVGMTLYILTRWNWKPLQKHTLQSLSYSLHSLVVLIYSLANVFHLRAHNYHVINKLLDYLSYIGSAAVVQLVVGYYIDELAGRNGERQKQEFSIHHPPQALVRAINLLNDAQPQLLQEVLDATLRDYRSLIDRESQNLTQRFRQAVENHPEYQDLFENISYDSLIRNPETSRRWRELGLILLVEIGFLQITDEISPGVVLINNHSPEETAYQDYLHNIIKTAFTEIYRTDHLARYFSENREDFEQGKENLTSFYGETIQLVANYSQFKELEDTNSPCPGEFTSSDLAQYNERKNQLLIAQNLLQLCSLEEKQILIQKLFIGDLIDLNTITLIDPNIASQDKERLLTAVEKQRILTLFRSIGNLASALHQGNLMSQTAINVLENGMDYYNLFQKALQEAAAEC